MACFRLVTVFPDPPLFKVPLLRSRITFLTFWAAFLPYLAIDLPLEKFLVFNFVSTAGNSIARGRYALVASIKCHEEGTAERL